MHAHIINGTVADYPYRLRATDGGNPDRCAKRLYPEVSPLPGSWEQCTPEQIAALNAVAVAAVNRPVSAQEGLPVLVDGVWRQNWIEPPAYDPATHTCTWTGTSWSVRAIPITVPESVPAHQFYAALEDMGAMPAVQAYIYGADERTKMFFQKAPYFRRDAAGIEAGRVALGWSRQQVNQLFINAGNLTP